MVNTVFSDSTDFIQQTLTTADGKVITCWLRNESGNYRSDLLMNDSQGYLTGFMTNPTKKPSWMVPGVIFYSTVLGLQSVLTLEPSYNFSIVDLDDELGEKVRFSFVVSVEYE